MRYNRMMYGPTAKEMKRKSATGVLVWGVRSGGPSDQAIACKSL